MFGARGSYVCIAMLMHLLARSGVSGFAPTFSHMQRQSNLQLSMFDKLFEEEGPLGKGITVGKIQIAMMARDRSKESIFGDLERKASSTGDSSAHLALLAKEVCLTLLRRSDDWTAASGERAWFKYDDAGKAESKFNDWANSEAIKFEKVRMCAATIYSAGVLTENKWW